MKRDAIKTLGASLLVVNALVAFLSLTNLFLVAAGAIFVQIPDVNDLAYEYDAANSSLQVNTSFSVRNEGIYSVRHLDIESRLVTSTGYTLMEFNRQDLVVNAGEDRTFPISVTMDLRRLADKEVLRFLMEDGEFQLKVRIRADYTMGLTKFRSDEVIRYQWTAPLTKVRDLLTGDNLTAAIEAALGWAGPVVRGWLSDAVLDAALAGGEWQHEHLGDWADLGYRMDLNETSGEGAFDIVLSSLVPGMEWNVTGSVPLVVIDGQVYLRQEVVTIAP